MSALEQPQAVNVAADETADHIGALKRVRSRNGQSKAALLAAVTRAVEAATADADEPDDAPVDLGQLGQRLGFTIEKILKIGDGWTLRGHRADGAAVEVEIGDAACLLSPRRVSVAVAAGAGIVVNPPIKPKEWPRFAQAVIDLAEVVAGIPTAADQTRAWVRSALWRPELDMREPKHLATLHRFYTPETEADAAAGDPEAITHLRAAAWREGDVAVVNLGRLARYLVEVCHERMSHRALGSRLAAAGFKDGRPSVVHPKTGRRQQASVWVAPLEKVVGDDGGEA